MSDTIIEKLAKACRHNDTGLIEPLLNMNPELIDVADVEMSWTPLHRCVLCNHIESGRLLLELGADVNKRTRSGESALHIASENGNLEMARLLIQFHAEINARQSEGLTPLHIAAKRGDADLVQFLLESGADRDLQDDLHKKTPLEYAKDPGVAEMLEESNPAFLNILRVSEIDRIPSLRFSSNTSYLKPEECFSLNEKLAGLLSWLKSYALESLFKALVESGYDDLDQMAMQIHSPVPLTENILKEIGIDKIGHRKRLLACIYAKDKSKAPEQKKFSLFACCSPSNSAQMEISTPPSLERWLANLNLTQLLPVFNQAGFENLDHLVALIHTPWPVDNQALKEIGIYNPEHRQSILSKIKDDSAQIKQLKRSEYLLSSDRWMTPRNDEASTCEIM